MTNDTRQLDAVDARHLAVSDNQLDFRVFAQNLQALLARVRHQNLVLLHLQQAGDTLTEKVRVVHHQGRDPGIPRQPSQGCLEIGQAVLALLDDIVDCVFGPHRIAQTLFQILGQQDDGHIQLFNFSQQASTGRIKQVVVQNDREV